jgi:hypothetical protein
MTTEQQSPADAAGLRHSLPPEDPDAVRRRDLADDRRRRDTSNAWPRHSGAFGNAADRGATSTRQNARSAAYAAAHAGTPEVREVLANGKQYGRRFTPTQWAVLVLAYGEGRTDRRIEKMLVLDHSNVRHARQAAEAIAHELVHEWKPALTKWQRIESGNARGESLTAEERKVLKRHAEAKRGRAAVPGEQSWEPMPPGSDVGRTNT